MKLTPLALALLLSATALPGLGQASDPVAQPSPKHADASADALPMADGEVRRIDIAAKKISLKHGEIKNLDMPPMTMVFQVSDPSLLDKVKVGDKIRFTATQVNGAYTVTSIEPPG